MFKRLRPPRTISESNHTLLSESDSTANVVNSNQPGPERGDLEPIWSRFLIVPGLLCTSIFTFLLIAGLKGRTTITGRQATIIINNPSTFSALRQILASLLGAVYMLSVCALINWSSRVILGRRPVTLDRLDFWSALVAARIDWTLPAAKIPVIVLFVILTRIPAALWAGALAPRAAMASQPHVKLFIDVPNYTPASLAQYAPQSLFNDSDPLLSTRLGVFSFSPVRDRFGYLLNDGAAASSQNASYVPLFKKNDNSNYTYYGRSYGVGASIGLIDKAIGSRRTGLNSLIYNETGTMASISCIFNRSADFHLDLAYQSINNVYPNIYYANGCPPWSSDNRDCGGFSAIGMNGSDTIVAISWWAQYPALKNFIGTLAIASGSNYTTLNNSQCNVTMQPRRFNVNVNVKQGLITVLPYNDTINSTNPPQIVQGAFNTIAALSEVASTKFTSAIGNMLNSNINNVLRQETNETINQKTLRAIAESMQVVTDDALVAYSSAQLMLTNSTRQVPVSITVDALTIGTAPYIYIVTGLNAIIVLLVIAEAVRTKGWKGMPRFNYMSVKSTIVSSSMAGSAVGRKIEALHQAKGGRWTGGAKDRLNGGIRVRLRRREGLAMGLEDEGAVNRMSLQASAYDMPNWDSSGSRVT